MKNTKNNAIFNLNNTILSAVDKDSPLAKDIIAENDRLSGYVDRSLRKTYKMILDGYKLLHDNKEEANNVKGMLYLSSDKAGLAFWEFVRLWKKNKSDIELIKNIARALLQMKAYKVILKHFLPELEKYKDTDNDCLFIVACTYFGIPEHYEDAIPLFEEYVEKSDNPQDCYFRLAYLYERVYQDQKLDTQIKYAKEALKTYTNSNLVYTLLAKMYYRKGDKKTCVDYLNKMMNNNPTAEDRVAYSRFLMKEGKITEAYDIYRCRFETGNVTYPTKLLPEKRWDGKQDLSNATVIVHYEQGFGDTIMFARYIPEIAKKAKKVIFVVQKNLIPLFKSSGYDKYCELLSHEADISTGITLKDSNRSIMYSAGSGMARIEHDFHIPLMDLPYLVGENPDRMTEAGGYLMADPDKVKEFREKYIAKDNKIKIGLAYHGTKESILTYRDISVQKFMPLFKMEGLEFYSFQSDKYADELQELDKSIKITDLGKVFKNFEDTACAMNCMDVIISTDNVVMNLAGALGIKTYCLFNVISESRWYKTKGDDVGWYKSVKPFSAKTFNDWDNLMLDVKAQLIKDFDLK